MPHISRAKAKKMLADGEVRGKPLTKKQRGLFGVVAGSDHRSFAENTEAFNDTALGETPPRSSIPRGHPARDALPRAVGRPAGVRVADGTESPRTDVATKQAASRSSPSGGRSRIPAAVSHYSDAAV